MEPKKRKAYSTPQAQYEADKRYLSNEENRKRKYRNNMKSNGKNFILKHADMQELHEFQGYIDERKKVLKK